MTMPAYRQPKRPRPELPLRPFFPRLAAPLDTEDYEEYVAYLKAMMRHDLAQAEAHSDAWERRKDDIADQVERTRGAVDSVIMRARCKEDVILADKMDGWSFFERRAKLYAEVLQAEMAARLSGFGL